MMPKRLPEECPKSWFEPTLAQRSASTYFGPMVPKVGLNLPLGVKVLSITPSRIQVSIREVKPLLEESEESGE